MSKQKGSKLPVGMVTSNDGAPKRRLHVSLPPLKQQKRTYLVAALLLVVIVVAAYLVLRPDAIAPPPKADVSNVNDYALMTSAQADQYLYNKTGLTIEYLLTKKINGRVLKNYDAAYNAARALGRTGHKAESLAAYKVAASKNDNTDYRFHTDYASVALDTGDKDQWKKQMLAAKEAGQKEKGISDEARADLLKGIDMQIKTVEEEQQ